MKSIEVAIYAKAEKVYLSKLSQSIRNSLEENIDELKINPHLGNQVSRKQIPPTLKKRHDLNNLWRVELSNFWRLLYTIYKEKEKIIVFIVFIGNHNEYNNLFGY